MLFLNEKLFFRIYFFFKWFTVNSFCKLHLLMKKFNIYRRLFKVKKSLFFRVKISNDKKVDAHLNFIMSTFFK
jgi:hypothetical protein